MHRMLYKVVCERLGPDRIVTDHRCIGFEQNETGVTLQFRRSKSGTPCPLIHAEVAIACGGVNSTVRAQFYPDEKLVFTGINTWRGATRRVLILTGRGSALFEPARS